MRKDAPHPDDTRRGPLPASLGASVPRDVFGRPQTPTRFDVDRLKDEVDGLSATRAERIREIKRRIAGGDYRVDPDRVAVRILDEATEDAAARGRQGLSRWPPR